MHFALTSSPDSRESLGGLGRSHYPTKTPGLVSPCSFPEEWAFARVQPAFHPQLPHESEPSGLHSRGWEFHLGKIPVLPLFILLETLPSCHHYSCPFRRIWKICFPEREREKDISNPVWSFICLPFTSQLRIFSINSITFGPIFPFSNSTWLPPGYPKASKLKIYPKRTFSQSREIQPQNPPDLKTSSTPNLRVVGLHYHHSRTLLKHRR